MVREKECPSDEIVAFSDTFVLVLCNDEVNTFNFVISALVEVCNHDFLQAEQCAMITHFNGRCDVKYGDVEYLTGLKRNLLDMGLTATIEKVKEKK